MYLLRYRLPYETDWSVVIFYIKSHADAHLFEFDASGFIVKPLLNLIEDKEV